MEKVEYYILFPNYTEGMKLESLLKQEGIKYVVSPTPRKLASCCGISIKYYKDNEDKIKEIVKQNNIDVTGFFPLKKEIKNFYA
ncbi:DUF3343 domain-containing protein [Hathewaya limosa]|uniref:Putative Se/S carrier protein-like domain-containing protein n=1 Tax=Hathewaya limosa TaxID=1536 RepID=A0ABU0JWH1_HATLI|nr:DUF3343 domain-containing protein [Hathewaya limosa]AWZ49767.1 hypothetical protein C3495_01385 [Clostridiaceae bacterium 14S0207]MDQ0480805.1 hypothetical protein [Hathewaya limosa]